jgi:homoserine kinase
MYLNQETNEQQISEKKMLLEEIKVFAPATVANVGCAFDILGFALENIGDEMIFRKTTRPGVRIISKGLGNLPTEPEKNVAGVVALEMLKKEDSSLGVEIEINKLINPGSGIGSSAASASGTAFGLNALFRRKYNTHELIHFAMLGEALASGAMHADNVAPAITGEFSLIRGYNPLDLIVIEAPRNLYCTIIHPQIEIKTKEAREMLPKQVNLKDAVTQWGNVAGLIAGLYKSDYQLIARSLKDTIIEPKRAKLIPGFYELKQAALDSGAVGCSISGSGPSVFALSEGKARAEAVYNAFNEVYKNKGIDYNLFVSKIGKQGSRIQK